MGKKYGYTIY